jgi:alkanesulfonate monooxygenase SsuD/methylene tetrahydromethanopterin reductase-like flavin-dependent oxidoreductase (luciferase family)
MTAELADGWLPVMILIDQRQRSRARTADPRSGARPEQFTARARGVSVANTPAQRELRCGAAGHAAPTARMGEFTTGSSRQASRPKPTARAAWAEGGPEKAAAAVPREMMSRLGFIGSTEECCERLEQEEAAGATLHGATVLEDDPREAAKILAKLVG